MAVNIKESGSFKFGAACLILLGVLLVATPSVLTANASKQAKQKYSRSHKSKYKKACHHIKGRKYKKAHKHLRELAKKGDPRAQTLLGLLYEKGVGVEKDAEKAISYYEKAALNGIPQAESNLGHLLLSMEKESEKVSLEAAGWLKKAAKHGQVEAQVTLGKLALDVKNSPINQNEAVWYLKDAAKKGNDQAKSLLQKLPKPPSSALGNPAQQVSAGVQGLTKSWSGYAELAKSINQAASTRR